MRKVQVLISLQREYLTINFNDMLQGTLTTNLFNNHIRLKTYNFITIESNRVLILIL